MTELRQHEILDGHLREVWRRDRTLHRTAGLLALFSWALMLFLIAFAVDWLLELPAAARVAPSSKSRRTSASSGGIGILGDGDGVHFDGGDTRSLE